jgi:hypothetical protein
MEPTHLLFARSKSDAEDWQPKLDGGDHFIVAWVEIDPASNAVAFHTDAKTNMLLHDEIEYSWRPFTSELRAEHDAKQRADDTEYEHWCAQH